MNIRLDGRTALITGGSKGLGLATAIRFAEAGAEVAILARNAETLETAKTAIGRVARCGVAAFPCDVTDPVAVQRAYDSVLLAFGKVDILVNNAGTSQTGRFEDITDTVWQADLDLKLLAAIRLSRLVLPQMKTRRWGRIINVLATAAKAPRAQSAPTSVSRAAGMALTRVLARRSEEHTSELQSLRHLVCRLLLEKKKPPSSASITIPTTAITTTGRS